jgi:hypothetical protein
VARLHEGFSMKKEEQEGDIAGQRLNASSRFI